MNAVSNTKTFIRSSAGRATSASALTLGAIVVVVFYFMPGAQTPAVSRPVTGHFEEDVAAALPSSSETNLGLSREKLASIDPRVAPVVRAAWPETVRLTGRVELNASRVAHVSSLVDGVVREVPCNWPNGPPGGRAGLY